MSKTETVQPEQTAAQPKTEQTVDQPCKYYKADFILNPKTLGFDELIVKTALEKSDKTEFTVQEAKDIVTKFANKEVKK